MKYPIYLLVFCLVMSTAFGSQASSAADGQKLRTVLLDLKANNVDQETVNIVASLVSAELSQNPNLELITSKDIQSMAALEADKRDMGCDDSNSCLAELAGALGARLVIFGDVGMLGPNLILGLSLFDSEEAKAISRIIVRTKDLGDFPDKLEEKMIEFLKPLDIAVADEPKTVDEQVAKAPPTPEAPQAESVSATSSGGEIDWLKVGGGAAAVALGAGALLWAESQQYGVMRAQYTAYQEAISAGQAPDQSFSQQDFEAMNTAYTNAQTGQFMGAFLMVGGTGLMTWGVLEAFKTAGE